MKKIGILLLALVTTTFIFAQNIKHTVTFEKPIIKTDKMGLSEIEYKGSIAINEEGIPLMPVVGIDLLLPQITEAESVKIISIKYYDEIKQNITIKPAGKRLPISKMKDYVYKVVYNDNIYKSSQKYPQNSVDNLTTQFLAGHGIGAFTVCPVEYYPNKQECKFIKEITVEIITKQTSRAKNTSKNLKNSEQIQKRLSGIIENKAALKSFSYSYPKTLPENQADILIITNNALLPAFQNYIDYKMSVGYIVKTATVENIYTQYSGIDNQEKIRNCIIDYYQNQNIQWVVLGGDTDGNNPAQNIVPHRGFSIYFGEGDEYNDPNIPSDMYYSCLDGNWNNDGDDLWGEPGEEDVIAEVHVGRFAVDNTSEVLNFTNKIISYQNTPVIEDIEKSAMIGEFLWNDINEDPVYGADYKEEIRLGTDECVPIPANITVDLLYERDGSWSETDIYSLFNNTGSNLINHLGHSNNFINMHIYHSDITTSNFTNNGVSRGYIIEYTQGCYCGSIDNRLTPENGNYDYYANFDCFAEQITTLETGEVAFIGNTRYGWGGSSQYFDLQFFDAIHGEGITQIGNANSDSKDDNIANILSYYLTLRWCAYELTLFGDPSMDIWTATPTNITASYPINMELGSSQIDFTTNTPNARIGLLQNGELIGRAITDASGNASVNLFNPLSSENNITVSIIAHNKNRHIGNITTTTPTGSYVVNMASSINDAAGNNNNLVDYAETISLTASYQNLGGDISENTVVTLSTTDSYITITDNAEDFGIFQVNELIEIQDAFTFTIAENIPDHHIIVFTLTAINSQTTTSQFTVEAHAPNISYLTYLINDQNGNNNSIIDPGETADIQIALTNTGSAEAYNVTAILSENNNYLTLNNNNATYGNILPNTTITQSFNATASEDVPTAHTVDLEVVFSGDYNISSSANFSLTIGKNHAIIIDLDPDSDSGIEIKTAIENYGLNADYTTTFTNDINNYYAAFVCLGTYPNYYVLNEANSTILTNYLENEGNLYMEGAETWNYDPATPIHSYFNITGLFDGDNEITISIQGIDGTMTEGMQFTYNEGSQYNDHIEPIVPAFSILQSTQSVDFISGIAYDASTYKTIGVSHTFGALQGNNNISGQDELMEKYLNFFQLFLEPTVSTQNNEQDNITIYPNPASDFINITNAKNSTIYIYDILGKLLVTQQISVDKQTLSIKNFTQGTYILKITKENNIIVKKININ